MKRITFGLLILELMLASFAGEIFCQAQAQNSQTTSTIRWEWTDDGWTRRVEIHGKAEFNEDYSDVKSVTEGGFLRIEESHGGQTYQMLFRRDENGQLLRKYLVNGEVRSLDENGRKWIAGLLLTAVRQGAIDTDKRVSTMLRQGGVSAVLEEIASITGDYAKRIYFQSLLKNDSLTPSNLQKVLASLKTQIISDHEKANLLKQSADPFLRNSTVSAGFFQAVSSITSDYERRLTLSDVVKRRNLSEQVLEQMLDSASTISSDYEKATFLLEASNLYMGETRMRKAFLRAVETIKSDHERGRVLSALLKNKQIS